MKAKKNCHPNKSCHSRGSGKPLIIRLFRDSRFRGNDRWCYERSTFLFLIISITTLTGCAQFSTLERDYKKIVYFNGINNYEAITLAEKCLVKSEFKSYYKTFPAKIRTDIDAKKFPKYWFVDFSPKLAYDAPSYLVVIEKEHGNIILAKDYWPKVHTNLDWVFQRANSQNKTKK